LLAACLQPSTAAALKAQYLTEYSPKGKYFLISDNKRPWFNSIRYARQTSAIITQAVISSNAMAIYLLNRQDISHSLTEK
jgi:hypothetical protein